MKVLVCGSRDWSWFDAKVIRRELSALPMGSVIIHGACRGVDRMADAIAKDLGLEVRAYPAKWRTHGKAAGPIRNQQMLDKECPGLVLAFSYDLSKNKGTADMVKRAWSAGIEVKIIGV